LRKKFKNKKNKKLKYLAHQTHALSISERTLPRRSLKTTGAILFPHSLAMVLLQFHFDEEKKRN
jgi:hypothetical protein